MIKLSIKKRVLEEEMRENKLLLPKFSWDGTSRMPTLDELVDMKLTSSLVLFC